jgi:hypothetical protein
MSQARTSLSEPGLGRALRTTVIPAAYIGLPLLLAVMVFAVGGRHALGFDFHGGIWNAAQDLLNGRSPYRPERLNAIAAHIRAGADAPRIVELPVYPPAVMLALTPFGLLPAGVANAVFVALLVPLPALALRLVGVRDLRCYAIAYACAPVLLGIEIGTLSPVLMVGLAAAWRWRDRVAAVSLIVCAVICMKLFLWPLVVWLAATRRWRAAGLSVIATAVVMVAGFAVVGFGELTVYPRMLSTLSSIEQSQGYSAVSAAMALGAGAGLARALAVIAGVALLAGAYRRGWSAGDDAGAFALVVCAALVLSPIVWLHYLALLLVPLAVCYRSLRWPWLLPLALWLTPAQQSIEHPWGIAVAVVVVVIVALTTAMDGGGWDRTSDQPVMSGLL